MVFAYEIITAKKLRKLFGLSTYDDHIEKENADKISLEKWRSETENIYLKIRGSKTNESPYVTYFFEHCQYCNEFKPYICFTKQGKVHIDRMLACSKLRLNIKLLQDEPSCSCNKQSEVENEMV